MPETNPRKQLPSYVALAWPTLNAIRQAGGTATNTEIMEAVVRDLELTEQQQALLCGYGSRTLLDYRLAWARTMLKNMGAIVNDGPCLWSITDAGRQTTADDVQQTARQMLDKLVHRAERR